jgi:bisphosphoglycerate-independent phosphoglycerate mutase (AlkP superfamily)
MAYQMVPGSLFSSRRVAKSDPSILDLPVTILELFGIAKPEQMVGRSVFGT